MLYHTLLAARKEGRKGRKEGAAWKLDTCVKGLKETNVFFLPQLFFFMEIVLIQPKTENKILKTCFFKTEKMNLGVFCPDIFQEKIPQPKKTDHF